MYHLFEIERLRILFKDEKPGIYFDPCYAIIWDDAGTG